MGQSRLALVDWDEYLVNDESTLSRGEGAVCVQVETVAHVRAIIGKENTKQRDTLYNSANAPILWSRSVTRGGLDSPVSVSHASSLYPVCTRPL